MEKKNKKFKKVLTSVLAVVLAFAMLIGGGTYAYLQSSTDDVKNSFKTNNVEVKLAETTGDKYDIVPGTEQAKDPKVTVKNTVDAYVYVEVKDNTQGLITYAIADGWAKLEGYDNIYYREVLANADVKEFSVLAGDKVSYSKDLTNEDMKDKTDVSLTFNAKAMQKDGFADAVSAYNGIPVPVSTGAELKNALGSVKEGQTIKLENDAFLVTSGTHPDGTVASFITTPNVTIDLNGFTLKSYTSGNSKSFGLAANGLTLKNGTIELLASNRDYLLYVTAGAKDVVIEDVKIIGGMQVIGNSSATLRNVDIQANNYYDVYLEYKSTVTIESGSFKRSGDKAHLYTATPTDTIIVKGGDFDGSATPVYAGNGTVKL